MTKETVITKENFDALLDWLDLNRKAAGQKYEKIRQRLIKIFVYRGCLDAEELADTTINRVINKLPNIIEKYIGEPTVYFYGVADKIHLEWLRKQKKSDKRNLSKRTLTPISSRNRNTNRRLPQNFAVNRARYNRRLLQGRKKAKIEFRRQLASKLGITVNALQVKTCRIRANLQKCVRNCVSAK